MGLLIDSDIFIAAERGTLDLTDYEKTRGEEEFVISAVTASELLHGVWRAKDSAIRTRRIAFLEDFLDRFAVLSVDLPVARIHARLWAELETKGAMIGAHDAWIAASCIAHGHTLVTRNVREFKRVPGLKMEAW